LIRQASARPPLFQYPVRNRSVSHGTQQHVLRVKACLDVLAHSIGHRQDLVSSQIRETIRGLPAPYVIRTAVSPKYRAVDEQFAPVIRGMGMPADVTPCSMPSWPCQSLRELQSMLPGLLLRMRRDTAM